MKLHFLLFSIAFTNLFGRTVSGNRPPYPPNPPGQPAPWDEFWHVTDFNASGFDLFNGMKSEEIHFGKASQGCFQIETLGGDGVQNATGAGYSPGADTRIYVMVKTVDKGWQWVSLDDDSGIGYLSRARVWIDYNFWQMEYHPNVTTPWNPGSGAGGYSYHPFLVTGYDTGINNKRFGISISTLFLSYSSCLNQYYAPDPSPYPLVELTGEGTVILRRSN